MLKHFILATTLTISTAQAAPDTNLPEGWEETPASNAKAKGDFDGNGEIDFIRILKNQEGQDAIFANFTFNGKPSEYIKIQNSATVYGIDVLPNNNHQTFCAEAVIDDITYHTKCLKKIKPSGDIIMVEQSQNSQWAWYWDGKDNKFKELYLVSN